MGIFNILATSFCHRNAIYNVANLLVLCHDIFIMCFGPVKPPILCNCYASPLFSFFVMCQYVRVWKPVMYIE